MDLLDYLLYTLARIGLLILFVLFGAFVGGIFIPAIVSFLPYSAIDVKTFFTDPVVQSAISLAVVCFFCLWVFYDDGKRHTAYENWSSVNITIVILLMFIVYFIPVIFRDSFHAEGKADVFYKVLYYPCGWFGTQEGDDFMLSVIVTESIIVVCAFAAYLFAYKIYTKKHPSILGHKKEALGSGESEDETDDLSE